MRVLFGSEYTVYTDRDGRLVTRGGGENRCHQLARGLVERGHQALVLGITESPAQRREEVIAGVEYRRVPVQGRTSLSLLRFLQHLKEVARTFDVVDLNQFSPHLILPFLNGRGSAPLKVATVHDIYSGYGGLRFWREQFGWPVGMLGFTVERGQLFCDRRYADKIVTVSTHTLGKVDRALGYRRTRDIVVIPNGISLTDYQPSALKGDYLLYVGRLMAYKHPEHLITVLAHLHRLGMPMRAAFIYADDPQRRREKIEALARQSHLEGYVEFYQRAGEQEKRRWLAQARVLVHPSVVEGQGMVLLEALASGTPVAAYDLPVYKDFWRAGVHGELAPAGEPHALADKVRLLLERYDGYRQRTRVGLDDLSWERVVKRYITTMSGTLSA